MPGLPKEMQYRPSQTFQQAVANLNAGLVEAGERIQKPMTAQSSMVEITLPLFNLFSQYIRVSQADTYGYFMGLCGYLYEQQQTAADDNIILAVDPELAEEVSGVTAAARDAIDKTKAYIRRVQEYLADNKPIAPDVAMQTDAENKECRAKYEAQLEMNQGLREDALRVISLLQESYEDLGTMSDNVDSAVYEPEEEEGDEEEGDEDEEEEGEDEVALPSDEPYESVIGD